MQKPELHPVLVKATSFNSCSTALSPLWVVLFNLLSYDNDEVNLSIFAKGSSVCLLAIVRAVFNNAQCTHTMAHHYTEAVREDTPFLKLGTISSGHRYRTAHHFRVLGYE